MNVNPELYDRTNRLQERDGLELLHRIRDHQQQGLVPGKVQLVIDIGCGSGNITDRIGDFVSHERTIGIDKSYDMIEYARSNHHTSPSISYMTADICASDAIEHLIETETADIVLSIHCLHWIPEADQGKALANIRNLMRAGGMGYLLLFSWSDMLPLQEQLVYHPRWRKYFKSVIDEEEERNANHLNVGRETERRRRRSSAPFPTFDPPSPEERIRLWKQRCSDLFFQDIQVSLHSVSFDFGDWNSFEEELRSICHFLPYIPQEERHLFLEDYYDHVKNTYASRQRGSGEKESAILTYEYLLVQVRKPQTSS